MTTRLLSRDIELLVALVEHSILTTEQVTRLQGMSGLQVARRRTAQLEKQGLIQSRERQFRRRRGRPEKILSISPLGADLLREKGLLPDWVSSEQLPITAAACEGHQLLLNWFRIHLQYLPTVIPSLDVGFLSPGSLLSPRDALGRSLLREEFSVSGERAQTVRFVPDGAFRITSTDSGKSVLFLLEVDMGTEPLACPDQRTRDLRTKVLNYQAYFKEKGYRRYEEIWQTTFNGFRLLFVTATGARCARVCSLIEAMAPTDFIWVTDASRLFQQGLADAIWSKGGNRHASLESILGRAKSCCSKLPALNR